MSSAPASTFMRKLNDGTTLKYHLRATAGSGHLFFGKGREAGATRYRPAARALALPSGSSLSKAAARRPPAPQALLSLPAGPTLWQRPLEPRCSAGSPAYFDVVPAPRGTAFAPCGAFTSEPELCTSSNEVPFGLQSSFTFFVAALSQQCAPAEGVLVPGEWCRLLAYVCACELLP